MNMVTINGKSVGPIGFGLMRLTWNPSPPPEEQCFRAMKAALKAGANYWNAAELYGTPTYNSLHLLHRYFSKYPEDADKVVLNIKGGLLPGELRPDGSEKNIRRSVDECLRILAGTKSIDVFECARVDPDVAIETSIAVLGQCVREGKIGAVGLSEVSEDQIRRASKVERIATVEVEMSLFSPDILQNGVAKACHDLGIPVVAYSPLSRGLLTGTLTSPSDIPEGDIRHRFPRFHAGAFDKNLALVEEVKALAQKKNCTAPQVAIAWITGLSARPGMPVIVPIPGATTEARVQENVASVKLSEEELQQLEQIRSRVEVVGDRHPVH